MRTRTMRLLLGPLVALALVATACGDDGDTASSTSTSNGGTVPTHPAGSTMERIQRAGKLVVGTKYDQPLFGEKQLDGSVTGFDVEMAKIVARAIFGPGGESRIETVEAPSRAREQLIMDGKVDIVVATYTINAARKEQVAFAGPYYMAGQDILMKRSNDSIDDVEDLNGKKVCSVEGSTSIKNVAEKAPQADLSIRFDTYSKCVEALNDDRVEAVTTDNIILAGFVARQPNELKITGRPFTEEPYGIGLKKDDQAFRSFLNDVIEQSYEDGSWRRAFEEQVGRKANIPTPEPPKVDRY